MLREAGLLDVGKEGRLCRYARPEAITRGTVAGSEHGGARQPYT